MPCVVMSSTSEECLQGASSPVNIPKQHKKTEGRTRGHGITEIQLLVWLLVTPACAEVNSAMQEITSVTYKTSEQHKDVTQATKIKDMKYVRELLCFLESRNPFHPNPTLRAL